MTEEKLQLRIYGDDSLPALIYLPGLHGDWTLIGSFRKHILGKVRFVEMTYPRTLDWSLDDYAVATENALLENGITRGWLLGESFGSQPLWAMVGRASARAAKSKSTQNNTDGSSGASPRPAAKNDFQPDGLILAGGFVKHPMGWAVQLVEKITGQISLRLLIWILFSYAKIARLRYRRSPEVLNDIHEFVERRNDPDRRAAQHRLHLIAAHDFRRIAAQTTVPVFGLTGFWDPIVPWPPVRRWLKKNCPALHGYKVIKRADHNVLGTGSKAAAGQVLEWML